MTMYSGDEFYDDDITSGRVTDEYRDEHHEWGTDPDIDEFEGEEQ